MEKKPITSPSLEQTGAAQAEMLRLMRLPEVMAMTGLPRTTLLDKVRQNRFPKPVKDGPRFAAWPVHEVQAWIAARIAERDARRPAAAPNTERKV